MKHYKPRRLTTQDFLEMILLTTRVNDAVERFSKDDELARYPELARMISASKHRYHSAVIDGVEVVTCALAGRVMITFQERGSYVTVVGGEDDPENGCGMHAINATADKAKEMIDRVITAWDISLFRPNHEATII